MKKMLEKSDRNKILTPYSKYVFDICNTDVYEKYLGDNFGDILLKTDNKYLTIINDFYIEDDFADKFNNLSAEELSKYVENNYKDLVISNSGLNTKYNIEKNKFNINFDNLVKNGSLVLCLRCVIDFNVVGSKAMSIINKFEDYIKVMEQEMSNKLDITVKIIHRDNYIRKRK